MFKFHIYIFHTTSYFSVFTVLQIVRAWKLVCPVQMHKTNTITDLFWSERKGEKYQQSNASCGGQNASQSYHKSNDIFFHLKWFNDSKSWICFRFPAPRWMPACATKLYDTTKVSKLPDSYTDKENSQHVWGLVRQKPLRIPKIGLPQ